MGYHPRFENSDISSFITTRCKNERMWFINNSKLEDEILSYAAKFTQRYNVKLYALAIEGNHIHQPCLFPDMNRADYMRDFNSCVAKAVDRLVEEYPGGSLWARRYSYEMMPDPEDLEDRFFYTVLQPVQDGLVERLSEYPFYNCFNDAIHGIKRKFKIIDWSRFNSDKRFNENINIADYTEVIELSYDRLPGYEDLSQKEYVEIMQEKLEKRRAEIVRKRKKEGKAFLGKEKLIYLKRGCEPLDSKKSTQNTYRPRVLAVCPDRRDYTLQVYFDLYIRYQIASREYRLGNLNAEFPEGTYKPILKNNNRDPGDEGESGACLV